jgi:hypothetical protein
MNKQVLNLLFITLLVSGISCKKLSPKIKNVSYLRVNGYSVNVQAGEGTAHHNFSDLAVYVNSSFIGVFPVKGLIPVDAEDDSDVKFKPYVKVNGISDLRSDYPFIQFSSNNIKLKRGEEFEINPAFEYYHIPSRFKWLEDFEGNGFSLTPGAGTDTSNYEFTTLEKFEGSKSMQLIPTAANPIIRMETSSAYSLPGSGANIYLEIHYKCNQEVQVGLIAGSSDKGIIGGMNESNGWKKIYLFLTEYVSSYPASTYKIYFKSIYNSGVTPFIYIDNIKLMAG